MVFFTNVFFITFSLSRHRKAESQHPLCWGLWSISMASHCTVVVQLRATLHWAGKSPANCQSSLEGDLFSCWYCLTFPFLYMPNLQLAGFCKERTCFDTFSLDWSCAVIVPEGLTAGHGCCSLRLYMDTGWILFPFLTCLSLKSVGGSSLQMSSGVYQQPSQQ